MTVELSYEDVRTFVLPIAILAVGVIVKLLSRLQAKLKAEDAAIGLDLILAAVFAFLMILTQVPSKVSRIEGEISKLERLAANESILEVRAEYQRQIDDKEREVERETEDFQWGMAGVLLMVLLLLGVVLFVRSAGWREVSYTAYNALDKNYELDALWGVFVPIVLGLICLFVVGWATK